MNSTKRSTILEYFDLRFLEHLFDIVFSDFIESNSFLRDNPRENLTFKFIIRTIDIDSFGESFKNSSVVGSLMLRAFSYS